MKIPPYASATNRLLGNYSAKSLESPLVVDEFDKYFKVRKNVIYERARFDQQNQLSDEPAARFITKVHKLAENCEFGPMKEELICDRLVVGIHDLSLSERLQLEPDLTLDKTKRLIRQ